MSKSVERVWITTVDAQFRVTFPKELIDALGWRPETRLRQTVIGGRIVIEKLEDAPVAVIGGPS